jgi:hypothetical protein
VGYFFFSVETYSNVLKLQRSVIVGCRPNQKERIFLGEKHARGKRQLEGKAAHRHAWKT